MKRALVILLALSLATGVVLAQSAKSHDVTASVVKSDASAKTLTVKVDDKELTLPVEGDAVNQLKEIKAGDKVTLSCRDDESGAHKAITKITKAKA
jgi:hypothetical protein